MKILPEYSFIHREQKYEEAYKDLHPRVQIDVTPSRLVFWPYIQNAPSFVLYSDVYKKGLGRSAQEAPQMFCILFQF